MGARSSGNHVTVLDAVAQVSLSDEANFWFGRMLPPSDRANLYGPYCSHHRAVYTDGVQDGYPFVANGRDNGALYFGQFGKLRLEAAAYEGTSATGKNSVIAAGRAQYDFSHERPRVSTSSKKDASSPAATFPNRRTRSSAGI